MKLRVTVFAIAVSLLLMPAATAQNQSQNAALEANPGLVGAGSPIYGLEVAYDNAAMSVGLKRAGNVAVERAAEARSAMERNNTEAAQRAAENLKRVANRSQSSEDEEGISKAMAIMEETIANAPNEQARQGMQTALNNMRQAQDRRQEARQRRETAGQQTSNQTDRPQQTSGQDRTQDRQQRDSTSENDTSGTQDGSQDTQPAP